MTTNNLLHPSTRIKEPKLDQWNCFFYCRSQARKRKEYTKQQDSVKKSYAGNTTRATTKTIYTWVVTMRERERGVELKTTDKQRRGGGIRTECGYDVVLDGWVGAVG